MGPGIFRRGAALSVDLVALSAVLFHPFPLSVVVLVYWVDLLGGTARRFCQTVVAAPREAFSPTGPPAMRRNGDPNPLRFFTPKLGTLRPVTWLPPIAIHNLKPAVVGLFTAAPLTAVAVGATVGRLAPPFALGSWPTAGLLTAGGVAVLAKHGSALQQFVRSERPPARRILPGVQWLGPVLMALPVAAIDTVYAGADFDPSAGFTAVALLLVVGRITHETRRSDPPTGAEPFEISTPPGRPTEVFHVEQRAVRTAGALDGLVPRTEWDLLNVVSRLAALSAVAVVGFSVALAVGPTVGLVATGLALGVLAVGFVLTGIAHFELAFGTMEYRLYGDALVAYDTRLDAVQWHVPLQAIRAVSIERDRSERPPRTDAATVTLDRTDLDIDQSPYGFYRQSLPYVQNPERVAERIQQAKAR
ncbi:hypothetical protein [Halobacterium salinarum]|uniref:Uncharacterized protein n=1 Tax=Halobacterium salinarum (strain ATCC 33171 / DSM 3754 / JCM 8978 / NBRC 102687 / NCIMB 764 / 91-R6) TaxID=2597657 RepID=A0A4D6GSW7_HALS9|nr:hypothetical protein [Halobacterium salinarum]QCC44849.1 uncharacterized protein HBSAL_05920 [Halobacterium salinarum]TYO75570.1 hypothetical protein APQ99_01893 [Halobacterium salinarum DSM 3754]